MLHMSQRSQVHERSYRLDNFLNVRNVNSSTWSKTAGIVNSNFYRVSFIFESKGRKSAIFIFNQIIINKNTK